MECLNPEFYLMHQKNSGRFEGLECKVAFTAYHPNRFRGALTENFFEHKIYYRKGRYVNIDYLSDFDMKIDR